MTEAEWLTCINPKPMLEFLRDKASDRKLRLFAVACCRRIWHLLPSQAGRHLVDVAEGYADGLVSDEELTAADRDHSFAGPDPSFPRSNVRLAGAGSYAAEAVEQVGRHTEAFYLLQFQRGSRRFVDQNPAWEMAAGAASMASAAVAAALALDTLGWVPSRNAEGAAQADQLREIFGVLSFRQKKVKKPVLSWKAGEIVQLAQAIYADRAFDRLPMLADALEEAGCTDDAILDHCRGSGPHVRGCWVVDLLLGKA